MRWLGAAALIGIVLFYGIAFFLIVKGDSQ